MDMGIHCIDLLQFISGAKIKRVFAITSTQTFSYDVEDSASVLLAFDSGAHGYIDVNFNIPDNAAECRLEIYGTKGSLRASGTIGQVEGGKLLLITSEDAGYSAIQNRSQQGARLVDVTFGNLYEKEITSFGNSILNGTAVEVPALDALAAQKIVECAYKSSRKGKAVDVI